jgi:hypothetical protein
MKVPGDGSHHPATAAAARSPHPTARAHPDIALLVRRQDRITGIAFGWIGAAIAFGR